MADIDVEELLRQGGRQDDGDVSMDDLVAQGGRVEEAPGALRTFGRSFRQGLNPLWDEGAGFMGANVDAGRHLLETGSVVTPSEWLDGYRRNRDESRDTDARGAQAHPTTSTVGRVTGAVVQGIASGGAGGVGRGLVGAVTSGATQGAANALAGSEADLTRLKAENYARAATDTLEGGAAGAAGGTVGYGVGKGLAYVGGKARDVYRGARGVLEDEARAGLEAEEAALRSGDAREAASLERAQGQGLEMNKRADARASRGVRPSPAAQQAALPDEPGTRTLGGYEGQAHGARKTNEARVEADRARLARPDISPDQRQVAQRYVDKYADAVDDPYGYIRRTMEENLRRAGYPRDMVERIMRERVGPNGEVIPRGGLLQPALPERTQTAEPADWLKRGHDMEALAQQGGGGPSAFGEHFANTETRVDPRMQPDPFHDALTRPGLVQIDAHAPDRDGDAIRRVFSFADKGSGKEYQITAYESPHDPRVVVIGGVGERGKDYMESWGENANSMGPKAMRELLREIARAFPGAERVGGFRVTGISPNRGMNVRLPEVTKPGFPPQQNLPHGPSDFEAVLRDRNLENLPLEGRRASIGWDETTQTQVPGMPPIPAGARRMYRGEAEVMRPSVGNADADAVAGGWYSDRLGVAEDYAARAARDTGTPGRVRYTDVPEDAARGFRTDRLPEGRLSDEAPREWLLPESVQRAAGTVPEEARLPPAVGDEGSPAYVPYWSRGSDEAMEGNRFLTPERAASDEATWMVRGMGDETQVAPRPASTPEPLPPMEELTQSGAPSFPPAVQRYDILSARPAPRAGQPYAEVGAPRRSALPPEDAAAAEEAMAARRAAAFGSNPSGPAPEPTAGARPRAMPPEASASMRAPMDGPEPSVVTDTGMDPRFEPTFAEGTRATRVPEVRRAPMRPEATTVQPPPEATQVGGPSDFTDATRYAPPDMAQRLAGRPSVDGLVDERIAGGGQALRGAFMRGATGEGSAALGLAGLALGGPAGSLKALALRGGLEVVREALRNPAAKARAIEAFKLQRLAAIRPEVWGRVSATLQRAAQRDEESGTDYHARAARHALLQTDPAFRAAEAEAAKELQGLSEDELARRLTSSR